MLSALHNQLHGLGNNNNRYDRGIYHTAAAKAHQCSEELDD